MTRSNLHNKHLLSLFALEHSYVLICPMASQFCDWFEIVCAKIYGGWGFIRCEIIRTYPTYTALTNNNNITHGISFASVQQYRHTHCDAVINRIMNINRHRHLGTDSLSPYLIRSIQSVYGIPSVYRVKCQRRTQFIEFHMLNAHTDRKDQPIPKLKTQQSITQQPNKCVA